MGTSWRSAARALHLGSNGDFAARLCECASARLEALVKSKVTRNGSGSGSAANDGVDDGSYGGEFDRYEAGAALQEALALAEGDGGYGGGEDTALPPADSLSADLEPLPTAAASAPGHGPRAAGAEAAAAMARLGAFRVRCAVPWPHTLLLDAAAAEHYGRVSGFLLQVFPPMFTAIHWLSL